MVIATGCVPARRDTGVLIKSRDQASPCHALNLLVCSTLRDMHHTHEVWRSHARRARFCMRGMLKRRVACGGEGAHLSGARRDTCRPAPRPPSWCEMSSCRAEAPPPVTRSSTAAHKCDPAVSCLGLASSRLHCYHSAWVNSIGAVAGFHVGCVACNEPAAHFMIGLG